MSYTELMNRVGIRETGKFNYHLEKIATLLSKERGLYSLNTIGLKIYELTKIKNDLLAGKAVKKEDLIPPVRINRIGIVLCTCGGEIDRVIDVERLVRGAKELEGVISVEVFTRLCAAENVEKLSEWCRKNFINILVIAACSPEIHKQKFNQIRELTSIPIEVVNIREQCAWVHIDNQPKASEKAGVLIEAAVKASVFKRSFPTRRVDIRKSVAVIGGGVAGLTVAQFVAKAGCDVYLVEKKPSLGGKVASWSRIYGTGDCASCLVSEFTSSVALARNVRVLTNSEVKNISGRAGNFELTILQKPRFVDASKCLPRRYSCIDACPRYKIEKDVFGRVKRKVIYQPRPAIYPQAPMIDDSDIESCRKCRKCEDACNKLGAKAINLDAKSEEIKINVGAVVFAIGGEIYLGKYLGELGYNPRNDIITSVEFEKMLSMDGPTNGRIVKLSDGKPPECVAIIQCVNEGICSGFCCRVSRKYLESIREQLGNLEVHIFYDRRKMPVEIPYYLDLMESAHLVEDLKVISKDGRKVVVAENREYEADLIILNVGMIPNSYLNEVHKIFEFSVDKDGFLRPESLPTGIFACGSITRPKDYDSILMESRSTALEVITLLSKDKLTVEEVKIEINYDRCGLCGLCRPACPFKAITIRGGVMEVDDFKCRGCGACAPMCPTGAIEFTLNNKEVLTKIETLASSKISPKVLALCCAYCGYAAADDAGVKRVNYPPGVFILQLPCTGRVDSEFILHALYSGFDGVMIVGCRPNSCRYIDGIKKAVRKVDVLRKIFGAELEKRVRVETLSAVEGINFAMNARDFIRELSKS
ncbi:MAG: hydrogenase iron-sulfur subunit [Candidatus Bathyarchaeia archaeon]